MSDKPQESALQRCVEKDAEIVELKRHIGTAPSMDRIKAAHSYLRDAIADEQENPYANGHRPYHQGEGCYICALSFMLESAEQQRDKLAEALKVIRGCLVDGAVTLSEKASAARIETMINAAMKECEK